jgi:hypothetical protein
MNGDRVDVRVVGGAGLAWVAVVICTGHPPLTVAVVAGCAAALGGLALVAVRRGVPAAAAIALAAFCVALALLP